MKNNRHYTILKLINETPVETQEELADLLSEHGFNVTQATVSRDIKELKLVKTRKGNKYCYAVVDSDKREMGTSKYRNILADAVLSVEAAMNIAVIKCHTGMANAACVAIDYVMSNTGVGTIAGDDTIFVAFKDIKSTEEFVEEVKDCL